MITYGFRKRTVMVGISEAMNRTITIKNTKRIKHLTFTVPSKPGVYLLVGGNGAGKTTILICLHRICEGNAFFNGFRVAAEHDCIDRYEDAAITYTGSDKRSVTFRKREQRWVSQPKANKDILASFGLYNCRTAGNINRKTTMRRAITQLTELMENLGDTEARDLLNNWFNEQF